MMDVLVSVLTDALIDALIGVTFSKSLPRLPTNVHAEKLGFVEIVSKHELGYVAHIGLGAVCGRCLLAKVAC